LRGVRTDCQDAPVRCAGTGLNLLVSNAEILTPGPLEVLPLEAIRREFEVNVFGGFLRLRRRRTVEDFDATK
jgi:NAD(P)-dependent dehydrogenase (short-subunit alcohol dehydrogenase family)